MRCAAPSASWRSRPSAPTSGRSRTGSRRRARVRQRGAHQVGPRRTKSRGRPKAPDLHLDTSSPAPAGTVSHEIGADNTNDLTFIRRPERQSRLNDVFTARGHCWRTPLCEGFSSVAKPELSDDNPLETGNPRPRPKLVQI